jgi:D-amino-acid oxidase
LYLLIIFYLIVPNIKINQSVMERKAVSGRRRFLKLTGINGVIGLAGGMAALHYPSGKSNSATFCPVRVAPERVIRTVAGLRPFRPSGFVLEAIKIGNRLVINNYGHGGGGVSLSWGTAVLAVEKIEQSGESRIAVAGCGVIGLSVARILQRKGFTVTIYTKDIPPETTSNVACAFWSPGSVFEEKRASSDFLNTFYRAARISQRIFQDYTGNRYGIRWIRNFFLGAKFHFPGGVDLYPGFKAYNDGQIYFGYRDVEEISGMIIETPVYLNALLQDFYLAGGKIRITSFTSERDLTSLKEKIIMNCTGLGSRQILNDLELVPVKGQLSILLPQPEINYSYMVHSPENLLYMFPRKDGIILGGTYDKGNWSLEPDEKESSRILNGHSAIADSLGNNNYM